MTEIVGIEVDGVVEGRRGGHRLNQSRWLLPVVVAAVGTLVMAALVVGLLGRGPGRGGGPLSAGPATKTERAPAANRPVDSRIQAVRGAMSAWGDFAATGDVGRLDGWFEANGPQYRALAAEAATIKGGAGGAPYAVVATDQQIVQDGPGETVVAAKVRWSRAGEADQTYLWDVVLRRAADGRWALWTIREGEGR